LTGPRRAREVANPLSLHDRALGLLAVRQRSRRELGTRLVRSGFDAADVAEELDRLGAVGLLDDRAFAAAFAEEAITRRLRGRREVAASLAAKGIDRAEIELALQGIVGSEEERAFELARSRARRLVTLAPDAAYRRLVGLLARRGYEPGTARSAARRALDLDQDGA
jgi:regulatory protein